MEKQKLIDFIIDLLTEFDEMGFAPTTTVPDPEAYAIEWRNKLTNALADYRKQEWISVEERLPNEYTRVIGCVTEKVSIPVSGECYRVGNRFHFPTLGYNRPISYWMPLPEPPKGE